MHPEIKKFWEQQGKQIFCLDKKTDDWKNVPMYYYFDGLNIKQCVAAKWDENKLAYWTGKVWMLEEGMLQFIKLPAFM